MHKLYSVWFSFAACEWLPGWSAIGSGNSCQLHYANVYGVNSMSARPFNKWLNCGPWPRRDEKQQQQNTKLVTSKPWTLPNVLCHHFIDLMQILLWLHGFLCKQIRRKSNFIIIYLTDHNRNAASVGSSRDTPSWKEHTPKTSDRPLDLYDDKCTLSKAMH